MKKSKGSRKVGIKKDKTHKTSAAKKNLSEDKRDENLLKHFLFNIDELSADQLKSRFTI